MRYLLLSITALMSMSMLQAQDITEKYWAYRKRLWDGFVVTGTGPGRSICAAQAITMKDGRRGLYFGDVITYHGWYVSALATEYALLKRSGAPADITLQELCYALQAVERLDLLAETLYADASGRYGEPALNGFFVRDDIDTSYKRFFPGTQLIYSDYLLGQQTPARPMSDNEMSQDQVIHLLQGLCLTYALLPEDAAFNGYAPRSKAAETGLRILRFMSQNNWHIQNPVTGKPLYRGPDARIFSRPLYRVGVFLNGGAVPEGVEKPAAVSSFSWPLTQTGLIPVFFNRAMVMLLATEGNAWGGTKRTGEVLKLYDRLWDKPVFPLVHRVLYRNAKPGSPAFARRVEKLLLEAPAGGPARNTPGTWNASNRWLASRKSYRQGDSFFPEAQNTGLDYMVLHNVYRLVYEDPAASSFRMPDTVKDTFRVR